MLKKTIKYTDYNEKERTDDFYFNLTKTELTELELSEDGGLIETIEKISKAENNREIFRIFKKIILMSFGKKSDDGRFIKSEILSTEFSQTVAFDILITSFFEDSDLAVEFIKGVIPELKK